MGIRASGMLNVSQRITYSKLILLKGVRFIPDNDDSVLELYNDTEDEFDNIIAYLDKDVQIIMFDEPYRCDDFLYAKLINNGKYIIYYDI